MNLYERGKQLGHDWKALDKPNWYRCNGCGREVEITFYIDDPHSIAADMNLPICSKMNIEIVMAHRRGCPIWLESDVELRMGDHQCIHIQNNPIEARPLILETVIVLQVDEHKEKCCYECWLALYTETIIIGGGPIYILTSGEYEDSKIHAVFLDFDAAVEYSKKFTRLRIQKWVSGDEKPIAILYSETEYGYIQSNYKRVNSIEELRDA